jgi:iron complex transport system substrate-binding protein
MPAPRFLSLFVLLLVGAVQAAVHVDDANRRVEFATTPQRVITLAPNLTEYVYAVGAGSTLVGTMDTSNYPEAAQRVARIGDYQRLDVERILSLKPDVVLVWLHGNRGRELEQLEAAGIKLFYLEPRTIDDVSTTLIRVGALLGHSAQAQTRAAELRRSFVQLRGRYAKVSPVTVFFQVWTRPVMTLNDHHLTSDLMAVCGGKNVFGALPALAPQVSVESVVAADPQAFFTTREFNNTEPAWRREPQAKDFAMWQGFNLTAVKQGWMFTVPGDLVTRQGPRAIDGARAICAALDEVRRERGTMRRP